MQKRVALARTLSYQSDMRHQGQEDPLSVEISLNGLAAGGVQHLRESFDRMHCHRRGFTLDGEEIEILSVGVTGRVGRGFFRSCLGWRRPSRPVATAEDPASL